MTSWNRYGVAAGSALCTLSLWCSTASAVQARQAGDWWLEVGVKAHAILVDPQALETHEVIEPEEHPMGLLSPDRSQVAFLGSEPGSDRPFDLFLADVDLTQPSGKSNIRRLTTDQDRPIAPKWMPGGKALVFLAGDNRSQQLWLVKTESGSRPRRISREPLRCYDATVTDEGVVYYLVHKGSRKKQQFKDLVAVRWSEEGIDSAPRLTTLLEDQDIFSYALSPDGRTLAWSGAGSLHLLELESGQSREIPLHAVHRQLLNHGAHHMAWRPDGDVIAIQCGFLGGIAMAPDAPPDAPWPRMFAADKIFFVPLDWSPSEEALKVGAAQEDFPSPTADDPDAEISPPAGDESKPWWVRGLSQHPLTLKWIDAEEGRKRVAATQR